MLRVIQDERMQVFDFARSSDKVPNIIMAIGPAIQVRPRLE
jgi:hypothetical protein